MAAQKLNDSTGEDLPLFSHVGKNYLVWNCNSVKLIVLTFSLEMMSYSVRIGTFNHMII